MVVFKMRDSVHSARYSSVCNVLRLWSISLIPTYRVYRLHDKTSSVEIAPFYRLAHLLSIPRKRSGFCRLRKHLKARNIIILVYHIASKNSASSIFRHLPHKNISFSLIYDKRITTLSLNIAHFLKSTWLEKRT